MPFMMIEAYHSNWTLKADMPLRSYVFY